MFGITGHRIGDAYRNVVSSLSKNPTESKFVESGTLTPEEFVQAGDQLTYKFPTWQWASGESSRRGSYLPGDKQYLITRNVPCRERVRALDYVLDHETRTEGDWLLPDTTNKGDGAAEEIRDIDDLAGDGQEPKATSAVDAGDDASKGIITAQDDFISAPKEDGGLPDFSDLDAQLAEQDPGKASASEEPAFWNFGASSGGYVVAEAPDAHIAQCSRTYDLSITYDKYYQTPRLWLFGYDEEGKPLKPELIYEDVLSEYVAKTVTVDPHPLTGIPTVSIHPCKHSQVMKKVVQDWVDQGITPRTDLAIFVFLKFISSVVPTINYDFTMDIEF
jgi:ubiquitin-like-conjugating enzyme ATG3